MKSALDRLQHDEPVVVILKLDARHRDAVWHAPQRHFQFQDEPPGTADPGQVAEWWPAKFKR